ncbi:MAG: DUF4126 domain-containing protein [Candidatus Krumholzibacteriia bacterium]
MVAETVLGVLAGVALAAACGLRVFLPLLVMSAAAHTGHFTPAGDFAWLGTTPALIALGVATAVEIAAYHVPWLDHLLDVAGAPLAATAGVIVLAAASDALPPFLRWTLAVVAGGGVAGLFHGLTAALRLGSTLSTGGAANPVFAGVESAGALTLAIVALALPVLALIGLLALAGFALHRRRPPVRREAR